MKKTLTALALAASFTALAAGAQADEMPIKGTCVNGSDTVTFTGSRMPIQDPSTGDFGVTQIWMSLQDYNEMLAPHIQRLSFAPGPDLLVPAAVGELSVAVATDPANDRATLRASNGNFDLIFENHIKTMPPKNTLGWTCDIKPNF